MLNTNTHCLTVPKEYMRENVKYSELVEKIYVCMYRQIGALFSRFEVLLPLNINVCVSHNMLHMCVQLLTQTFINPMYNDFTKEYFLCDTVSGSRAVFCSCQIRKWWQKKVVTPPESKLVTQWVYWLLKGVLARSYLEECEHLKGTCITESPPQPGW